MERSILPKLGSHADSSVVDRSDRDVPCRRFGPDSPHGKVRVVFVLSRFFKLAMLVKLYRCVALHCDSYELLCKSD